MQSDKIQIQHSLYLYHNNALMSSNIWDPTGISIGIPSRMEDIGLKVNDRTIANKIASGGFSAVFFLQCMEAIGVKNLSLDSVD